MKKTLFMLLMGIALGASAQNAAQGDKHECKKGTPCEMGQKGQKCAKKGKQCDPFGLSDKDAEKFKETFAKYMADVKAVRDKHKVENPAEGQRMDDAQMDKKVKENFAAQREILAVQEKYYGEFRKFLTARQAAQLFRHGNAMHHKNGSRAFQHGQKGMKQHCDKKDGKCDKKDGKCPDCEKKDGKCDKKDGKCPDCEKKDGKCDKKQ